MYIYDLFTGCERKERFQQVRKHSSARESWGNNIKIIIH